MGGAVPDAQVGHDLGDAGSLNMAKHWKDVKDAIEKDLDRIMWEEPVEVRM